MLINILKKIFQRNPQFTELETASKSTNLALNFGDAFHVNTGKLPNSFVYNGYNRSEFYRHLRDHIPVVSSGIWTWVHLCATPQRRQFKDERNSNKTASELLDRLDRRIYPRRDGDIHGLERLNEAMFLDLFTLGSFAMIVHFLPNLSGIRAVEILDPYSIRWIRDTKGGLHPYIEKENGKLKRIPEDRFFHRSLVSDLSQPGGVETLASIPFVVEIEQRLLKDMAAASHNAGTPRLQITIDSPESFPGEDQESYHQRINSYFNRTVSQFRELGPDDNVFTWSDVKVQVVGGSGEVGTAWKINREQVIEDVITGLKLFPWTVGRSHGTTKNWIYAQYNLLMQIVDSVQRFGIDLAEWLMFLELRLHGNLANPCWEFSPNQDPFIVDRNRAKLLELDRIERLVEGGFISKKQGIRELGYTPDLS